MMKLLPMTNEVDIQIVSELESIPEPLKLACWAECVLSDKIEHTEMAIRVVDEDEIAELNLRFRNKPGPTNVLSFACDPIEGIPMNVLGDIVICAPIVEREAAEQGKSIEAHWAHMIVHGVLHLLGYDHIKLADAQEMEAEEKRLLSVFGFANPYEEVVA